MLNLAAYFDHTLLAPTATSAQIVQLCEEAVEYAFPAVCIPPLFVPLASRQLYGSGVQVCSVVGFPCGYNTPEGKLREAEELLEAGADELDMVISIGRFLQGDEQYVRDEIEQLVVSAGAVPVKVIIECCYLTRQQMERATELVVAAGAAYVKTSTGFGPSGAALEDVNDLVRWSAGRIKVKAAGGIRSLEDALAFVNAGAVRIGCSSSVRIMQEWSLAGR